MRDRLLAAARRPVVAALLLLLVYVALSFVNDDRAFLSSDTGSKVASLQAMQHNGGFDLDVGYWAAAYDPAGTLHPLYQTQHLHDRWIAVTTVPMLLAAEPLFRLGGYRLALLLPMLGAVGVAFAARALAARLGASERRAWTAFWIVGLASPTLLYALDFWEHTVGLALMGWAAVFLLDVAERRAGWRAAAGAGSLLGIAFSMRTEAVVYAVVLTTATCIVLWRRHDIWRAVRVGGAAVTGFAVVTAAEVALELVIYGKAYRFARASGAAVSSVAGSSSRIASVPGSRVSDALVTTFGVNGATTVGWYLLAIALTGLLVYVSVKVRVGGDRPLVLAAITAVAVLYVTRASEGLGFVPGLFAAAPLAALALGSGWTTFGGRWVRITALSAIPLVWASMYVGGAAPQWGGRYMLPTGFLLIVAAVVDLPSAPDQRWLGRAAVGLSAALTVFGFAWMVQRTHTFADAAQVVAARPEPVIVSTVGHFEREAATYYSKKLALTAINADETERAAAVVKLAGYSSFGLLRAPQPGSTAPVLAGWQLTASTKIDFFASNSLEIDTYRATP